MPFKRWRSTSDIFIPFTFFTIKTQHTFHPFHNEIQMDFIRKVSVLKRRSHILLLLRIAIVDMFAGREKKIGQNIGKKGSLCAYQEGDRR